MRSAEQLYDLMMGHRLASLVLLVVATVAFSAGLTKFQFDNSYTLWFVEGDPALVAYDGFLERFGSDESVVIGLAAEGDPLSTETLEAVQRISDRFADHAEVNRVWSLTHSESLFNTGGMLEVRTIVEEVPVPPEDLARLRADLEHGSVASALVSDDGAMTGILLMLEATGHSFEPKMQLVQEVRAALPELAGGRTTWITGGAPIDEALFRYSERDSMVYAPIMAVMLMLVLGVMFRSPAAVVLPMFVVGGSVFWALGFMSWIGWVANIVSTILPPMLTAVAIADSVHLLQQYRLAGRQGEPPETALKAAFVRVFRPCLLTTLTTAAGMASLSAAKLSGVRELGLTAAVGVIAAFFLTMIGLPLALSVMPNWALGGLRQERAERPVPPQLEAVARFAVRRPVPIVLAAAVVVAISVAGMLRLEAGSSMTSYFWPDDPVYQEGLAIDHAFGGSLPGEVLIESVDGSSLLEPESLAAIDRAARFMESQPATAEAISAADLLREARRVLKNLPPGDHPLPESRAEAAQILLFLEGDTEISRYLTPDRLSARITVPVEMGQYESLAQNLDVLQVGLAEVTGGHVKATITGLARLMGGMEEYLIESQIRTFSLAFVLVLGFIALFFLSWRAGLLSAVPNLFPLIVVLGIMGWAGIPLDLTTVMLAPLLLGIVVDDTVHVLERVLEARGHGASVPDAFVAAIGEVGHAVAITSAILAVGFLVPVAGSFKPNFFFATLSCAAILLALVGDLVVFPAVGTLVPKLVRGPGSTP